MKATIRALLLFLGIAVLAPAAASAAGECQVCGTSGGGGEMLASFDDGFGEECVALMGNGYGFDECTVHYVGTTTFCEGMGSPTCRNGGGGESLATITAVDGYLVTDRSLTLASSDVDNTGAVVRSCDGLILERQLSTEQVSSYGAYTMRISI